MTGAGQERVNHNRPQNIVRQRTVASNSALIRTFRGKFRAHIGLYHHQGGGNLQTQVRCIVCFSSMTLHGNATQRKKTVLII